MKTVSTGTGLCALSGALLLCFFPDRAMMHGAAVSAASASPANPLPRMQSDSMRAPEDTRRHSGVQAQLGGEGQCALGEPLNWFTTVHVLPPCVGGAVNSHLDESASADVDGDGATDLLIPVSPLFIEQGYECSPEGTGCVTINGVSYAVHGSGWTPQAMGQFVNGYGLMRCSLSFDGDQTTAVFQSVMSAEVLQSALCAVAPCGTSAAFDVRIARVADVDHDGDGDLMLRVEWVASSGWVSRGVWIENTATSDPPLAADLNRDGQVNAVDLAFLLTAWTQ